MAVSVVGIVKDAVVDGIKGVAVVVRLDRVANVIMLMIVVGAPAPRGVLVGVRVLVKVRMFVNVGMFVGMR